MKSKFGLAECHVNMTVDENTKSLIQEAVNQRASTDPETTPPIATQAKPDNKMRSNKPKKRLAVMRFKIPTASPAKVKFRRNQVTSKRTKSLKSEELTRKKEQKHKTCTITSGALERELEKSLSSLELSGTSIESSIGASATNTSAVTNDVEKLDLVSNDKTNSLDSEPVIAQSITPAAPAFDTSIVNAKAALRSEVIISASTSELPQNSGNNQPAETGKEAGSHADNLNTGMFDNTL